jgi:TPR repeat protein
MKLISDEIRSRFQFHILINEQQLERLTKEAESDNPDLQYLLACYYYYGLIPSGQRDLKQAEYWLLKARKNGDLRAFILLIELAQKQGDAQKLINYTYDAINRGFLDQYYYLGNNYLTQKKYTKAVEAWEKAINSLRDYQNNPHFKWVTELAQVQTARLLKKGLSHKDIKKALEILTDLAGKNNIHALFFLAVAYLEGVNDLPRNIEMAQKLLSKIEGFGEPKVFEDVQIYYQTLRLLGEVYEKRPYKNIKKALEYYQKAGVGGKLHIARLVIAKKIPGDFEQAKKTLRDAAYQENPELLAAYLYGTMLIREGDQQEAISLLEKVDEKNLENHSLVALQLGIAYHYGFGVEQDEKKAQKYFNKILDDPEQGYRSSRLARGYLYLFGLGGVKKDITKGLALINESDDKADDVYFETDQLLPAIGKLRAEQAALMQKELIGDEPEKKVKKKKKRAPQPTLLIVEEVAEDDPFQTTEKEWNEYFGVDDGSYVSLIDKKNKVFIINDPKREQQLIVKFETLPDRDLTDIAALKYHKRILERQGHTKRRLKHTTKYNHDFAEMLDYVIQYLGESVPFAKDGSDKHDDQLIATVIRKDLKTGKEVINKAEYTFGQKGDDVYVYHRLLRPIKVAMP